jgi:charged multivesicular body protein 4
MNILKNLFGKNENEKPPTTEEAIQKLLEIEDLLKKRSDLLENKIDEQVNIAKKNAATNKKGNSRGAWMCLFY